MPALFSQLDVMAVSLLDTGISPVVQIFTLTIAVLVTNRLLFS